MADGTFNLRKAGIDTSKVKIIGEEKRPESLQKNLYKVNSPYDLTSDIVTKSLNALQSLTGYDYRTNPTLDIIERLVDAGSGSNIVSIGADRLIVEFQRRALTNLLGELIPTPKDLVPNFKKFFKDKEYKKSDASITDPIKDPNRSVASKLLQNTIGYVENENYLTGRYSKIDLYKRLGDNVTTSDLNYFYSGDMIKEKILQLNQNSVFSTLNVKNTNKIDFDNQSLVFTNTYSEDFIVNQNPDNNQGLYYFDNSPYNETYTKSYFKNFPVKQGKLTKDYREERKELENTQGFGDVSPAFIKDVRQANTNEIKLERVYSIDNDENAETNRQVAALNAETFRYDSLPDIQGRINTQFGVRRGLVYFTSKLAEENPIIAHNEKVLYKENNSFGNDFIYWKGNGECRTFTIYDQYDNYNRLIKFDGNSEKNSVLRDSVLPKIAPMIGDKESEKSKYFFTMENLAVKVTNNDDCDKGPNGGKWMWFVPYNVKITDNNSVGWSDINFLGRPEPIYSYQNTTRNLSLSFSLLIDTVKDIQDIEPTIQNYYNYIYACGGVTKETDDGETNIIPIPPPQRKRKPEPVVFDTDVIYFFKNDYYGVNYDNNIDYTSTDNCLEQDIDGVVDAEYEATLSGLTFNNSFYNNFTAATKFLVDNIPTSNKIEIDIQGYASKLFTNKKLSFNLRNNKNSGKKYTEAQYNSDLGYRRAYDMFKTLVEYFNSSNSKYIYNYTDKGYLENQPFGKTITDKYIIDGCEIIFKLKSKGSSNASGDSTFANRNNTDEIKDRQAVVNSIKAYPKEDTNTNVNQNTVAPNNTQANSKKVKPCDPDLTLDFEKLGKENKFPTGYEKLNTFVPSFNSQTPFDFTKRYVFLHQLTRPSRIRQGTNPVDNIVFGRMPVFILRYGDFLHTKAFARSINFDITESTWDLNPEGMGAIPLMCNVTMDLTLIGGQSLAGPIDRIQTANDSAFIANTTFNTGRYKNNNRFKSSRGQEFLQYKDKASGQDTTQKVRPNDINPIPLDNVQANTQAIQTATRTTQAPFVDPTKKLAQRSELDTSLDSIVGPTAADLQRYIDKDQQARDAQIQIEAEAEELLLNSQAYGKGL